MKETVLKAVAQPPQFFKAPYRLAIFNILFHVALMCVVLVVVSIVNPLFFIVSGFLVHFYLIYLYKKEPHIDNILKNIKIVLRSTNNLDGENVKKYFN